jgi:hypothetical protein
VGEHDYTLIKNYKWSDKHIVVDSLLVEEVGKELFDKYIEAVKELHSYIDCCWLSS